MVKSFRLCLVLTLAGLPAAAQQISAELAPAQTQITWTLGDVLHTVHGTFKLKRGELHFDPSAGTAAGQIVVDVTSGESGSGARDRRMHNSVLESAKYPEATFTVDRVQGQLAPSGVSHLEFHGTFRIHGSGHEIAMPAVIERNGDDLTATVHFVIPYVKWGMRNPSNFLLKVNDHVEMDVKTRVHARVAAN